MGSRTKQWRDCKHSMLAVSLPRRSGETLTWEDLIPDNST